MAPKKSKTSKASLKKVGTMAATAAVSNPSSPLAVIACDRLLLLLQAGQEFLKQSWGEDKLNKVNALLDARDKSDSDSSDEAPKSSAASKTTSKSKSKPKLSKARTMKSTATVRSLSFSRPSTTASFRCRKERRSSVRRHSVTLGQKPSAGKRLSKRRKHCRK